jgi:hypothetical protein
MTERTWPANKLHDGRDSHTQLALVTGASSGIGRAFARRLGADGYDLVVVGRRRDRLEELAVALPKVKVRPLVADLGTDAGVEVVADLCAGEELTMLVNNAGVAHYMPFAELPANKANASRRLWHGRERRGHNHQCVGHACVPRAGADRKAAAAPGRVHGNLGLHCRAVASAARRAEVPRCANTCALPRGRCDRVP